MIVILSHAHPSVSKGGAEVSAYTLFRGLLRLNIPAAFVAMCPEGLTHKVILEKSDEYIVVFRPESYDHMFHCTGPEIYEGAKAVLDQLKPSALIFHHFLNLGINALERLVDRYRCPSALVLHEFLALCQHHGQMVTNPQKKLCFKASPSRCSSCFPAYSPESFNVREVIFKRAFDSLDKLISPSHFLAERFAGWGVPQEKLVVIENGLLHTSELEDEQSALRRAEPKVKANLIANAPSGLQKGKIGAGKRSAPDVEFPAREKIIFGYFGQINPFKGVDLLLDAIEAIEKSMKNVALSLRVHGNIVGVDVAFEQKFNAALSRGSMVEYYGSYNNVDVLKLMHECDYIVMASNWWENSPVVIQEAFAAGRPLVVPNIGGMAEKVVDGVSGHHFLAGDAQDLARVMLKCAGSSGKGYSLPSVSSAIEMASEYLANLRLAVN